MNFHEFFNLFFGNRPDIMWISHLRFHSVAQADILIFFDNLTVIILFIFNGGFTKMKSKYKHIF